MTREITVRCEPAGDPREVRIALLRGSRPWLECFVRSSGPALRPSGDALLCLGLLPAIELGCDLRIELPVDRGLLAEVADVQRMVAGWTPGCRPVRITAPACVAEYPADRGHGLFFSGGVDSAYSLAVHRDRLDGIVTLIGCDVSLADRERATWLAGISRRVAAAYGIEPIIVETDLSERMHRYLGWIEYHGSALAGIRHFLADRFATMRVAASVDEATMWDLPWGSHPGLDPRLGTAGATILLDGLVSRPEKLVRLLDEPTLLENLRVCYHGGPTCGTCQKCLTTWICLDVLGGGRPMPSFPPRRPPLDASALAVPDTSVRNDRLVLREAAVRAGGHEDLIAAIDKAVAAFDRRRPTLAERLHLKERMRVTRHRWRFARDTRRSSPPLRLGPTAAVARRVRRSRGAGRRRWCARRGRASRRVRSAPRGRTAAPAALA